MGFKIIAGSLNKASKLQDSQGMDRSLSKVLNLGTSYRIFIPLTKDENGNVVKDIALAAVPGRRCDFDALGISFVVLDDFEVTDMDKLIDKSGLSTYSRIASVLYDASYRAECSKLEREMEANAAQLGRPMDETALKQGLDKLYVEFYGDSEAKPNKIYPSRNKLISGPIIEIATRVVVVPLTPEGKPEFNKVTTAQMSISSTKKQQLLAILNNPDYNFDPNRPYLEVNYTYSGKDKNEAGRTAAFQGVSRDTALCTKFAELWESEKDSVESKITSDPEIIASKNMSMSSNKTSASVITAFMKYLSKHEILLANIDMESDVTKAAADDMVRLNMVDNAPAVKEKLIELAQEARNSETDYNLSEDSADKALQDVAGATSLKDLDAKIDGDNERLDQMVGTDLDAL